MSDVHAHRRQGDHDDSTGHRMEAAAESTFAKLLARFGTPVMLGIIGYYVVQSNNRVEGAQEVQGRDIAQIKSDVRDVNTRLDAQVIRTVESQGRHIDNIEQRVQLIERVVKTP